MSSLVVVQVINAMATNSSFQTQIHPKIQTWDDPPISLFGIIFVL